MTSILALLFAALALAPPAQGRSPDSKSSSGIKGRVLDTTCLGPCMPDPEPQPYRGDDARIVIRAAGDGNRLATPTPRRGRFRVSVASGR